MNATITPSGPLEPGIHEYTEEYRELIATNYFGLASFVVLLYDHVLTFDDEVRYIWRGNKKLVAWLFLINRYITPLGFAVNISAYTSPAWTPLICEHFVRYEGAMTLIGISIASLMMGVRVTAIYHKNRAVLALISSIFVAMVAVNAWLLSSGVPVHHPTGIHGCSMIFGAKRGTWASASAWLPLLYDTVVVILVVLRTRDVVRAKIAGQFHVVQTLVQDGVLYYSVILAANLVLALMIAKSSDGVKNICAQFQLLITVTMMSRITLNLRRNMQRSETSATPLPTRTSYSGSTLVQGSRTSTSKSMRISQVSRTGTQSPVGEPRRSVRMQIEELEADVLDISHHEALSEGSRNLPEWRDEF